MKRMLALLFFGAALVILPVSLFAQSNTGFFSYYKPGNVAVGIEVGPSYGYYYGVGLAGYPSLELFLAKYRLGDYVPLDFGVAAKARLGLGVAASGSGLGLGAGGFGTAHFGFRGVPGDFGKIIGKFDFVVALGIAWDFLVPSFDLPGLGFASYAGFNYFLNDNLSVSVLQYYWGRNTYYDTTIGLRMKFGSAEAAKKAL